MSDLDVFRQDLSGILLRCAKNRRASLCGGVGNGDDLKIIALFKRLARDAETLDPAVFARYRAAADKVLDTRCFVPRREALLAQVGILYWPKDAADLIGWMGRQSSADRDVVRRADPAPSLPKDGRRGAAPGHMGGAGGVVRSWASDFSAGFGIVAPLLSIWNVGAAIGQMHDRAFMAEHATVQATVASVDRVGVGRSGVSASDVVLAFRQPSGETCRVTWRTGVPAFSGAPGDTVAVVPRSSACELPLIPSRVGDPMQTFALAAALMAGGLASLKLWTWLFRHSPRPVSRPVWFPAATRRQDLA